MCHNKSVNRNRWDAVVFDYGRVLSQSPSPEELHEFARLVGCDEPPFFALYSDTRDDYDLGLHDCYGHWQKFAGAAGIALSTEQITRIVEYENRLWVRENSAMIDLARRIRESGSRTGILSNMPFDLLEHLRRNFAWLDEFEVQIWSCEHGIIKPDPAIYRLCLDALGCEADRVVFFDDRPLNVEAAREVGMQAHVVTEAEEAAEILRGEVALQT